MTILVADALPAAALEVLQSSGHTVQNQPSLSAAEVPQALRDGGAEILIVRSTRVTAEAIQAASQLVLVIRAGAGVNTIDLETANRHGVFVTNCPGRNAAAVAELTIGLIVAVDRRITDATSDFNNGIWNKGLYSKADGLAGKTLGILGFGGIGREVARRALGFDMRVTVWSRSLTEEAARQAGVQFCHEPDEVIRSSDILSLHTALTGETRGLIDRRRIQLMREGAILINTARAELVDEQALVEALQAKRVRAGVDVFQDEPEGKDGTVSSALQSCPGVVVTHHIGASTEQAQLSVAMEAIRIIGEFSRSGRIENWVNRSPVPPARCRLVVRHQDRPGVLANVLGELRDAGINAEEMENVIFAGNHTACCTIQLSEVPARSVLEAIRGRQEEVLGIRVVTLE